MTGKEKERQAGAHGSSVKAHPKKDGAGGQYTWGNPVGDANLETPQAHDPQAQMSQVTGTETAVDQRRPSQTSKGSDGGRKKAPQNNEHNFPDLGPPGSHQPPASGAWAQK